MSGVRDHSRNRADAAMGARGVLGAPFDAAATGVEQVGARLALGSALECQDFCVRGERRHAKLEGDLHVRNAEDARDTRCAA